MEQNFYNAKVALRDGQRETALLDSELRNLQFKVYNENRTTVNQIQQDIEDLLKQFKTQIQQERSEGTFLEGQMGKMRMENAKDAFIVRQMTVQSEVLAQNIGTDDDFFEVVPGYLQSVKQNKIEQEKENS